MLKSTKPGFLVFIIFWKCFWGSGELGKPLPISQSRSWHLRIHVFQVSFHRSLQECWRMCMCLGVGGMHLGPRYCASYLHPWSPLQNIVFSFLSSYSSVPWWECSGILGRTLLCMGLSQELQSYSSGSYPQNASHCDYSELPYTFPDASLLIVSLQWTPS